MIKGATGIVGLAVVGWTVGCGTHSGIGNLGTGGTAGSGAGGEGGNTTIITGNGGAGGIGGTAGDGSGGMLGIGGEFVTATGGMDGRTFCPGGTAGAVVGAAKTLAFKVPIDYPTGGGAIAVAAANLDYDSNVDLALLDSTAGVRVMRNNGDGTFAGPVDHGAGSYPTAMALGDLNGDQTVDVAVVTQAGIAVLRNPGNADFAPPVTYVAGTNNAALAVGDLNHDGLLDIVVADAAFTDMGYPAVGDVGILLNAGGATFSGANYPAATSPRAIAIGDLNSDCSGDLVVAGAGGLTLLLGNRGAFPTATSFAAGTTPYSIAIGDLNGDGKPDVVEGHSGDSVLVLLNLGGSFTAPVLYGPAPSSGPDGGVAADSAVAVADVNGDGINDILTLGSGLNVFLNNGDGTFATAVTFPMPPYPRSLAHGDFNGDGLEDIAVVSNNGGQFTPASNLRVLINGSH